MFKKQEKTLIIICLVIAVIMLVAFVRSTLRFMQYYP